LWNDCPYALVVDDRQFIVRIIRPALQDVNVSKNTSGVMSNRNQAVFRLYLPNTALYYVFLLFSLIYRNPTRYRVFATIIDDTADCTRFLLPFSSHFGIYWSHTVIYFSFPPAYDSSIYSKHVIRRAPDRPGDGGTKVTSLRLVTGVNPLRLGSKGPVVGCSQSESVS